MPRWEPNARIRLEQAALELYDERGYDATSVGQIAERVGVTSRTFFRYYPDKREVLFGGADELRDRIVEGVRGAPASSSPMTAAITGLGGADTTFREREWLRRRGAVIASSTELQEREVKKLASIAEAIAGVLAERGADPVSARLTGDAAVAVFREATQRWMDDERTPYPELVARAAREFSNVVTDLDAGGAALAAPVGVP